MGLGTGAASVVMSRRVWRRKDGSWFGRGPATTFIADAPGFPGA